MGSEVIIIGGFYAGNSRITAKMINALGCSVKEASVALRAFGMAMGDLDLKPFFNEIEFRKKPEPYYRQFSKQRKDRNK